MRDSTSEQSAQDLALDLSKYDGMALGWVIAEMDTDRTDNERLISRLQNQVKSLEKDVKQLAK